MVDRAFRETRLAAMYDRFNPWEARADFAFYLPMVMAARSVLDIGCGTGELLRRAREYGHDGRLCGVDPAIGMLEVARSRRDVEWVLGDASVVGDRERFDLVVMTGHAFQVLVGDDEVRSTLAVIARALTDTGRFAFETRNPLVREWETWERRYSDVVTDAAGARVRCVCRVAEPVEGDLVSFTHTFTGDGWAEPEVSHSTLRFLDPQALGRFLSEAGLVVAAQFGDWERSPLTASSPEIITVARRG